MRVKPSAEKCIGSGNCVMTAPDYFDLDDDGIVVVQRAVVAQADDQLVRDAADRCPVAAIGLVVNEAGDAG